MAQRGILEYDGKALLARLWDQYFEGFQYGFQSVLVESGDELMQAQNAQAWLNETGLVAKPDMLFGKRGKNGLVFFKKEAPGDVSLADAAAWIDEKASSDVTLLDGNSGRLNRFIVEPFRAHKQDQEYYVSIRTEGSHDVVAMSAAGGVDVEDNWDAVSEVLIPVLHEEDEAKSLILSHVPEGVSESEPFGKFVCGLYRFFKDLHFTYLELNPFILDGMRVSLLDLVGKVDDTAGFLMGETWENLDFPSGFGRSAVSPEEAYISSLDEKSGSSLKLTILNPKGRVWTLVAGGGASVVFADTIAELWGAQELANYGEYSGNPSTEETYEYTKTVLDLMTREPDDAGRGKVLLIGGAIANFTDVAATFKGIIQALEEFAAQLRETGVRIYVRRGGPNYEIGLKNIRTAAKQLKLPIEVYGPETHMTDIVSIALEDCKATA